VSANYNRFYAFEELPLVVVRSSAVSTSVCPQQVLLLHRTRRFAPSAVSTFIIWALLFNTASFNFGTTAACKHLVTHIPRFSRFFANCQTNDLQNASSFKNSFIGESVTVIMKHQKQLEDVESFKYLGSILTNDGRCTCEIKCRIAMAKAAFNKKRTLFTSTLDLELRKKLVKCYIWSIALYGAETWALRAVDQKHLESFEIWCWRRMEKISWTDHVRNKDVLLRGKEQRNILHEIRKGKANWIGHILCGNCLLQRVIEGKIKGG